LALKKINLENFTATGVWNAGGFFSSTRQQSFGFSGQTDLMREKVN
jgi:hypothetical protein